MPDVVCPECGAVSHLVAIRRAAEEFCEACDFPLFWAPASVVLLDEPAEAATRRLPAVGGRQTVGARVCPTCGELNPLAETYCARCGRALDPPTTEPPPPVLVEPLPLAPDGVADESSMTEIRASGGRADDIEAAGAGPPRWNPLSVSLAALSGVLLVVLIAVFVV